MADGLRNKKCKHEFMITRERLTITLRRDLLKHLDATIDGKTVRNRSHAIERVLAEKFGDTFARTAVILGGGEGVRGDDGTRVSPLTVSVDGVPLVERHIAMLKDAGVTTVILAVGRFGDAVRAIVGDGARFDIKVMYMENDHGTAGVLRQARSILRETFVMFNGHIIVEDVDLVDMFVFHKHARAQLTMAVTPVADPHAYGMVRMRGNRITAFVEKGDAAISHLINAGMYIVEPEVCDLVRPEEESLERDIFPHIVAQQKMFGYLLDRQWDHV